MIFLFENINLLLDQAFFFPIFIFTSRSQHNFVGQIYDTFNGTSALQSWSSDLKHFLFHFLFIFFEFLCDNMKVPHQFFDLFLQNIIFLLLFLQLILKFFIYMIDLIFFLNDSKTVINSIIFIGFVTWHKVQNYFL